MTKAGRCGIGALVALVAAVAAVVAVAAVPTGTPDPKAVVLTAADFASGQAKNISTKSIAGKGTLLAGYEDVIGFLRPYGQSRYVALDSEAFVETDAASATRDYGVLLREYESASVRKELLKDFTSGIKNPKVTSVKLHPLGVQQSSELGFVVTDSKKATRNFSISVVRVDRVLVLHVAVGLGRHIYKADARAFATKAVAHAAAVLVPISISAPTVTSSPQEGQTLTATTGTWGGTPTAYTYQWQNCDPTGTTCNPIENATGSSYVVQPTDANLTIRVQVTATNKFGSTVETSAITAVVTPPATPPGP